jgi:hypothetical protein
MHGRGGEIQPFLRIPAAWRIQSFRLLFQKPDWPYRARMVSFPLAGGCRLNLPPENKAETIKNGPSRQPDYKQAGIVCQYWTGLHREIARV